MMILTAHLEAAMMTYDGYSDNHRSERMSDELDDGLPDWNWYRALWWWWWWCYMTMMTICIMMVMTYDDENLMQFWQCILKPGQWHMMGIQTTNGWTIHQSALEWWARQSGSSDWNWCGVPSMMIEMIVAHNDDDFAFWNHDEWFVRQGGSSDWKWYTMMMKILLIWCLMADGYPISIQTVINYSITMMRMFGWHSMWYPAS